MKVRSAAAILAAAFVLLCFSPGSDGDTEEHVRIYEVMPYGRSEGFSLYNYGTRPADLAGYCVEDGEGYVRFTGPLTLLPGTSVTVLRDLPEKWMEGRDARVHGGDIVAKDFQLNDRGDEVVLTKDGRTVDVFVYGDGHHRLWVGDPFPRMPGNCIALRRSVFDSDSAADWAAVVPGRSSFVPSSFESAAAPIVFPGSGDAVLSALGSADREILVSMYILDHPDVVSVLSGSLRDGVSVRILIEGSPSGGVPDREIGYMEHLRREGAEVRVMKNAEGFRRYSYLHSKYAVIDSSAVVVTTENWRSRSFEDNRGWGAVFRWVLGAEGVEKEGMKVIADLPGGHNRCVLHVCGDALEIDVRVPGAEGRPGYVRYVPIAAACVIVILIRTITGLRHRDDT